jgi:hypothetical protein
VCREDAAAKRGSLRGGDVGCRGGICRRDQKDAGRETQSSLGEQRCGVDESNKGEVQGRC